MDPTPVAVLIKEDAAKSNSVTTLPKIIRITPATIFKDGLHIISAYLSQSDWLSSHQVCHHWLECFSSSGSRGLSYPIQADGTLRSAPPSRLRHHFTEIVGQYPLTFNVNQLFSICHELPELSGLFLKIRPDPHDQPPHTITPTSITSQVGSALPIHLKELYVDLDGVKSSDLIRAISSCLSLTWLSLSQVCDHEDFAFFQSFGQLVDLKSFTLTACPLTRTCCLLPRMPQDLLVAMKWHERCGIGTGSPPNLRHLNICHGTSEYFDLTSFSQLRLMKLEAISLPQNLNEGDLTLILHGAPNLTTIDLCGTAPLVELNHLKEFKSLKSIRIWPAVFDQNEEYEAGLIAAFGACAGLTSINFNHWSPQLMSSWAELSRLPELCELIFERCLPNLLDDLLLMHSVRKLVFRNPGEELSDYIRDYFRSSLVMPELCHIEVTDADDEVDWMWTKEGGADNTDRGDHFRQPAPQPSQPNNQTTTSSSTLTATRSDATSTDVTNSEATPTPPGPPPHFTPAERLIGIELNPGPIASLECPAAIGLSTPMEPSNHQTDDPNSAPTNYTSEVIIRITPATMFKDGLHIISAYLDQSDWLSSQQVCHHWLESLSSAAGRDIGYPIEKDGTFRSLPAARLRHHFTEFLFRSTPTITVPQLFSLGQEFPSMTYLDFKIRPADPDQIVATPGPVLDHTVLSLYTWPHGVKELYLDLELSTSPHLIHSISSCISLVWLTLVQVSPDEDFSLFRSYDQLIHLDSFTLTTSTSVPNCDLLLAMGWHECGVPPNLRHLDLLEQLSLATFSRRQWNHLRELNVPAFLKEGDLTLLLRSAPNLTDVNICFCPLTELAVLQEFQSLQIVRMLTEPAHRNEHSETVMMPLLGHCTHLTSLKFISWSPQLATSWAHLSCLPRLLELKFSGCLPFQLDVLLPLKSLHKLVFENMNEETSAYVRDYFRSIRVMPQLCHIEVVETGDQIDWIWTNNGGTNNTKREDVFRELEAPIIQTITTPAPTRPTESVTNVPYSTPPRDLTIEGVEPNPGPFSLKSRILSLLGDCSALTRLYTEGIESNPAAQPLNQQMCDNQPPNQTPPARDTPAPTPTSMPGAVSSTVIQGWYPHHLVVSPSL